MENDNEDLSSFVNAIANPEALASDLLWKSKNGDGGRGEPIPVLLATTQHLFRRVEDLAKIYRDHLEGGQVGNLSGLEELYLGGDLNDGDQQVDTETLWGQVDLQNEALHSLLKPSIRKLSKATKRTGSRKVIRLLADMDDGDSGDLGHDEDGGEADGPPNDGDEDENEDEERLRIQARMERAMADMDEEDGDQLVEDEVGAEADSEEDVVDPARDGLRDGFFDLHEMEAWADEEEEYLPDSAYPDENPEDEDEKDKRSFHQRQRDGDVDDDVSGDSSEDENLLFSKTSLVRRKKYRSDDEVEALYRLYGTAEEEDSDDDEIINMTAADIFGAPNKKIVDQWKEKERNKKNTRDTADDDSWNDYDFDDKEEEKEASAWNEGSDDDSSDDEQMPMKDNEGGGQTSKPVPDKKSKLKSQTDELEKEMLAEKPWQMTGETSSSARPTNSLLDSTPEFEVATKMAPTITVEHTKSLEDIIKDRILNENFDDVIPRELPDVGWHAKRGELPEVSQEKSKLGLGELYEREYLKKVANYDVDAAEKESEEEKAKGEMKTLFANLCSKLDALSNYHFAPRPIEVEAEVRPVTKPAIAMEEVLPLHVSDARGVAPEEVYGAKRGREGILRTDSEMDQQERKRLRASKKAARRKARKQKLADEKLISRLQPGMGLNNPYEKRKMQEELSVGRAQGKVITGKSDDVGEYGSSGTFFKRMQEEAQQSIRGNSDIKDPSATDSKRKSSKSSSFKL